MLRPLALLGVLFLSACHISLHDEWTVNGVRLDAHHEEVLTLAAWPSEGLVIDAHQGDLRVEEHDGAPTLTVEVRERTLGEARAVVEGGKLIARAENGATCAIGRVVVRAHGPVRGLSLTTGCGDVEVNGLAVEGALSVSSGVGDLTVERAGQPASLELETGVGDLSVSHTHTARLSAETGTGSVRCDDIEAADVTLESGVGDLEVAHSKVGRMKADTGVGDIELIESSFETKDLDTGVGSVHVR